MNFFKKQIKENITEKDRIMGSLYGFFVGDALGVPVEFQSRETLKHNRVNDMEEYGTHNQPKGTWSDDSSMVLATIDSMYGNIKLLLNDDFMDYIDLMFKFSEWKNKGKYTPEGKVFDIGISTSNAISKFESNNSNPFCGDDDIKSNGNGSLMRILPISIFTHYCIYPTYEFVLKNDSYDVIKKVSSLTHSHDLSIMSCYIYSDFIDNYMELLDIKRTYNRVRQHFMHIFDGKVDKEYGNLEMYKEYFNRLIYNDISILNLKDIKSSGFVIDSLEASIWCILTTDSFSEAVLKAVNLGEDTDTIGALTGGLAGLIYGINSIPKEWINSLQRKTCLDEMVQNYLNLIEFRKSQNVIKKEKNVKEYMQSRKERRKIKATKDSWRNLPMTDNVKELDVNIHLSNEEIELIKLGHVPFEMEDHWFMYFDEKDNTINYYRSWTGMAVFKGYLDSNKNKVYKLVISLEKDVYSGRDTDEYLINQFKRRLKSEIECHK